MLHHGAHELLQCHCYNPAVGGYAWYGMRDGGPASMKLHLGSVVIHCLAPMLLLVEYETDLYSASRSILSGCSWQSYLLDSLTEHGMLY